MAKLKGTKIGLALGIMLAILYTLRTIILMLFPDFVINWANKIMYNMVSIKTPVITIDAFIIGIAVLFIAGFIWGVVFSAVYNRVVK